MDARTVARLQPPAAEDATRAKRAARTVVNFPYADHPLTLAHIMGAQASTHSAMIQAVSLVRRLDKDATEQTRAACKLAAEVFIERAKK